MASRPFHVVGSSVPRVDGAEKVTGKARYTGDLVLPGMLHGKILRSPHPHARIRAIDPSGAERLPGVVAILTRDDLKEIDPYYGHIIRDRPALALEKVRFIGEPVAAVAAQDEATAEEALALIAVDYEELAAALDVAGALAPGAPLLHETPGTIVGSAKPVPGTNICHRHQMQWGDVERGFAEADLVLEDTFTFPSVYHYALEPHTVLARWERDTLTVWASAQHPFLVRGELARIFRLPLAKVQLIIPFVGGGFGSKSYTKLEPLVAALALKARRPVRVAQSVFESFHTTRRHAVVCKVKTGAKRDGTLTAKACEIYLDTGAYADNGPQVAGQAAHRVIGPYRIPHVQIEAYAIHTNSVPAGSFRSIGAPQSIWACESHIDMLAERLGIDPLEMRLKNLFRPGEEIRAGMKPLDGDIAVGLRKTAELIGMSPEREEDDKGVGIACGVMNAGAFPVSIAIVRLHADGSATLLTGTTEIGQGSRTVLSQIAAEELSLPLHLVHVAQPDTASAPFDRSTGASRSTTLMGLAVQRAAQDVKGQLLEIGARLLGVPPDTVELRGGRVVSQGHGVSYADAITAHFGLPGGELIGRGYVRPLGEKPKLPVFWEIGIGGAEIEVDRETGRLTLRRYISAADVGKAINPRECEGQDEGAAMMGIGHTFFEVIHYEDGQIVNSNLVDYRVPRFTDLPDEFLAILVENEDGPGPYGVKGMGEGGIVAVAPAVANALYRATGVRIRDLPLTPERVWRALKGAVTSRE